MKISRMVVQTVVPDLVHQSNRADYHKNIVDSLIYDLYNEARDKRVAILTDPAISTRHDTAQMAEVIQAEVLTCPFMPTSEVEMMSDFFDDAKSEQFLHDVVPAFDVARIEADYRSQIKEDQKLIAWLVARVDELEAGIVSREVRLNKRFRERKRVSTDQDDSIRNSATA